MTTITLSLATSRNDGLYQVFGCHEDDDDRYVFGVADFARKADAVRHARAMVAERPGSRLVTLPA